MILVDNDLDYSSQDLTTSIVHCIVDFWEFVLLIYPIISVHKKKLMKKHRKDKGLAGNEKRPMANGLLERKNIILKSQVAVAGVKRQWKDS